VAGELELLGVFSGPDMMHTYPDGDKVYIVGVTYICQDFSGKALEETDETTELKWFDIDNLPDNISLPDKRPIEALVARAKRN